MEVWYVIEIFMLLWTQWREQPSITFVCDNAESVHVQ